MTRSVFYGFGAFVGSLTGRTSCGFWPDDPDQLGWDPAKQIPVELGKNPEAARRGLIKVDEIQVDDYEGYNFGGLTQIGPMWPSGKMAGWVFLESNYWNGLGAGKPGRIPPGMTAHNYELTSVLYWDGPYAGRRFTGVHGEIRQTLKGGTSAMVSVWAHGTAQTKGKLPFGTFWVDFAKDVHPIEKDFTDVDLVAGAGAKGALFIDSTVLSAGGAPARKAPQTAGGVVVPPKRRRSDATR
jgi:hypothetical protein